MYAVGAEITTYYNNSPILRENQYKLEQEVEIFDMITKELLATFIVKYTDEYTVTGIVNWVNEK